MYFTVLLYIGGSGVFVQGIDWKTTGPNRNPFFVLFSISFSSSSSSWIFCSFYIQLKCWIQLAIAHRLLQFNDFSFSFSFSSDTCFVRSTTNRWRHDDHICLCIRVFVCVCVQSLYTLLYIWANKVHIFGPMASISSTNLLPLLFRGRSINAYPFSLSCADNLLFPSIRMETNWQRRITYKTMGNRNKNNKT